jgi:hypothetical protein
MLILMIVIMCTKLDDFGTSENCIDDVLVSVYAIIVAMVCKGFKQGSVNLRRFKLWPVCVNFRAGPGICHGPSDSIVLAAQNVFSVRLWFVQA